MLVLHSENDLQTQSATGVYAQAFPNARLVVIKKASHFSFVDQPEEFAAVTRKFLDELSDMKVYPRANH